MGLDMVELKEQLGGIDLANLSYWCLLHLLVEMKESIHEWSWIIFQMFSFDDTHK